MAEINKPDLSIAWAASGLKTPAPDNTKLATGWAAGDKPPRWFFNWIDNRQDVALQHINQHGIAVWDSATEYQANKSYVQASNGDLYKAITTNTNKNPLTSPSDWVKAVFNPTGLAAENGWVELGGGIILQWGKFELAGLQSTTVILPKPLTSQIFNITCGRKFVGEGVIEQWAVFTNFTTTSFDAAAPYIGDNSTVEGLRPYYWQAIGI